MNMLDILKWISSHSWSSDKRWYGYFFCQIRIPVWRHIYWEYSLLLYSLFFKKEYIWKTSSLLLFFHILKQGMMHYLWHPKFCMLNEMLAFFIFISILWVEFASVSGCLRIVLLTCWIMTIHHALPWISLWRIWLG